MISEENKKTLLLLARKSIESFLIQHEHIEVDDAVMNDFIKREAGTFVTLTAKGRLRGCIGHIAPIQPIYKDVIDNALSAAFRDPRFDPISEEELNDINIEVSILSDPGRLEYSDAKDMFNKIKFGDGVIIQYGSMSAVFLPQVWDELPEKENFLSHLCAKAGLPFNFWKSGELDVEIFNVEKFSEK